MLAQVMQLRQATLQTFNFCLTFWFSLKKNFEEEYSLQFKERLFTVDKNAASFFNE